MKPVAKRLYGILASLVLLIASLIMYSSLIIPAYREIQDLRGERAATAKVLEEERVSVESVEELVRQYDDVSDLRETIGLTLPDEFGVASIVNQIQGIAVSNGMLINSLSLTPLPVNASPGDRVVRPLGSLRVVSDMTGDYGALKAFLESVETNIRVMDVHALQIAEGGTSGPYQYRVEIDTYYQL